MERIYQEFSQTEDEDVMDGKFTVSYCGLVLLSAHAPPFLTHTHTHTHMRGLLRNVVILRHG